MNLSWAKPPPTQPDIREAPGCARIASRYRPPDDEVAATVRPLVDKKRNQLVVDCDPGIGVMNSEQTKVRQTLFNLISNAAKFT